MSRVLPRALTPFRHASYRRLALALVLSSFATGVWVVAQVWEVIRIGGGPGDLSVVTTASAVGVLLPALLAGVLADRVPQKRILQGVASLELVGMSLVAVLSLTDRTALWHLAVVAFLTGLGMAFYYPAYSAWLPALVPDSDLQAVNGFEGMVRPTVAQAAGPAVAGVVVGAASPGAAVAVAAGASLLGLVALSRVRLTPVRREPATGGGVLTAAARDVREGFGYVVRTSWLRSTLLFASLMTLMVMGPLEVLVPFLLKDTLDGDAGDHAWVLAAFGIGGALGSLLVASVRVPRRYLSWMVLVWGFGCLPFALIGVAGATWVVVLAALVVGAAFAGPMVIWGTLLQRRVPPSLLGRVASLDFFVSLALMPLSMALAGPVSAVLGLRTTFLLTGVVPGLVAVVALLWARLRQDEIAHPLDEVAQREPEPAAAG